MDLMMLQEVHLVGALAQGIDVNLLVLRARDEVTFAALQSLSKSRLDLKGSSNSSVAAAHALECFMTVFNANIYT